MAAASYVRGRFITKRHKKWDAFTDKNGDPVNAGQSLSVFVYTEHDDDLCEIVPDRTQSVDEVLKALEPFGFGAAVEIVSGAQTFGKYRGIFDVKALQPAKA